MRSDGDDDNDDDVVDDDDDDDDVDDDDDDDGDDDDDDDGGDDDHDDGDDNPCKLACTFKWARRPHLNTSEVSIEMQSRKAIHHFSLLNGESSPFQGFCYNYSPKLLRGNTHHPPSNICWLLVLPKKNLIPWGHPFRMPIRFSDI